MNKEYLEYCKTARQREVLRAYLDHGTQEKAAKHLGINQSMVSVFLNAIRKHAAKRGYDPDHDMTHPTGDGISIQGTSTLYDENGDIKLQWVKTKADQEQQYQQIIEAFTETFETYRGKSHLVSVPKNSDDETITVYPMGDPHIGMYSWSDETGDDFDCEIAERDLCEAVKNLVSRSPRSQIGIVLNLGDFFHADSMENRTMRSGHALDVDTRWSRVLHIGARAMIQCVYSALKKHEKVIVKNVIGNHDDHTSQALSLALSLYFENNNRVEVDTSPSKFWYYKFGQVLLASTHGDTAKPDKLPGIMAHDRSEDWGNTKHRYWLTGHIHNKNQMEFPGVVWESFRTLAAKDAWHAAQGYRSGRDMQSITYHKDHGEVERHTMNISMLRA